MLPSFLIIGAQKAATTWLATCLGEHPDVFIPGQKEIYFFNNKFDEGLAWYASQFGEWSGQAAVGEATPGYISNPDAPWRIRATLGDVKLIASLRHPIDRAYSAFWHRLRNRSLSPDTDFIALFRQSDQFEIRSRGYYAAQLSRYLEHFPRESLLILVHEEIFQDSQQAITDCLQFLEVDWQFEPKALNTRVNRGGRDISAFNSPAWTLRGLLLRATDVGLLPRDLLRPLFTVGRRAFKEVVSEWGPKTRDFERLDGNLRQELLHEYYMSDIKQLESLLDRDLSIWYVSPHQ